MQKSRNNSLTPHVDRHSRGLPFHVTAILLLAAALWLCRTVNAQPVYENYTFLTFAGPGPNGAGSSDGTGSAAHFNQPGSIVRDANGNFYVADTANSTIRKISPAGQVTTLAGVAGFPGTNDGVGAVARFNNPFGIALDSAGYIYVGDTGNNTIRKISPSGVVTTFAGSPGASGTTNGAANLARFNQPRGIGVDSSNNLYVADSGNNEIRMITPAGVVSLFAGSKTGSSGTNNGTGASALFWFPIGVAVGPDGNIYVADTFNHTIRLLTPNAVVTTLAGLGRNSGNANGTNSTASFDEPFNLTVDANTNIYVTDTLNHTIRQVTASGVVTTPLGTPGTPGSLDATGQAALFHYPIGIAVDQNTNLFITEFGNDTVREANAALVVSTFAGVAGGSGIADANGNAARFNFPSGIAFDGAQNAFVTDLGNNTIRKITPTADVTTFAGIGGTSGTNDGADGTFDQPGGLTVDNNGNIFVGDTENNTIREISPSGSVTTIAGTAGVLGSTNATGTAAKFDGPNGVAVDTNGNIFVADTQNDAIREIAPGEIVTTFSGIIGDAGTNDGPVGTAQFNIPTTLAFGPNGYLYVVDDLSATIRKVAPDGSVTTFAGIPGSVGSTDGATAKFHSPWGIAFDSNGNSYVTDAGNNTIRKITPAGVSTTIGGTPGQSGSLDGTGSDARFNEPEGIAVDSQGNVYVADAANQSIRKGYPALPDMPVVDNIGAAPGVTRHFSILNQTTTTLSWTLVRQPANSTAQLVGTNTATPTFTPDVGSEDIYEVQFQGWDNSGHTTIRRITLYADDTPPTIAITNPVTGIIASNAVFNVAGITTDNLGVSNVFVQLNGGAWTNATGTTNWAVNENLVPGPGTNGIGTNIIRAYSQDFAGNVSATNEFHLPYVPSDRLKVMVKGGGTLKPNLNGAFLQFGQTYSITVKAVSGSTFSNWTSNLGPGTNSTTITFVMQSNLTLTANCIDHAIPSVAVTFPKPAKFYSLANMFIAGTAKDNDSVTNISYQLNGGAWTNATGTTNWFAQLKLSNGVNTVLIFSQDASGNCSKTNRVLLNFLPTAIAGGNYAGLFFDTNNLTATNAGFFSAALTPQGAFTAKLLVGGSTIPFSGQFSIDGSFSNSFVPKGFSTPFTVQLTCDLSGAGTITGSIDYSGWSSPLLAIQDVFSATRPPSQEFERFSLIIPGYDGDSSTQPGGNSFGTITIDGVGGVSVVGSLADGSPAVQKTFISKDGKWPFYISSSSGQGVTLGWLTFSPGQIGTLGGQVYWERLPQANAKLYPAGFNFTNGITVSASYYDFFIRVPTLIVPNGGQVVLQQAGILPALTNHFTLSAKDGVSSTNKLKFTISLFTGAFKGSMFNPANNVSIPISGVILTNQNAGFGFFINSNQSGSVFISTNSP